MVFQMNVNPDDASSIAFSLIYLSNPS
jgi:hypothetical protein